MVRMTSAAHDDYRLPAGFERCSKLDPVRHAVSALDRVRAVVEILVSPGGCPWDEQQTNRTLLKNLLEETYEYVDTVETDDREGMREELGDMLMQSVYQAAVCQKDADDPFTLDEVCDRLVDKLITRHPHVFAPDDAPHPDHEDSAEDVLATWNAMKQKEKRRSSVIEGISHAQGALPRAAKIVHRAARVRDGALLDEAMGPLPSSADAPESPLSPDDCADRILALIRRADAAGIDVESSMRNRLRDVERRLVAIEAASSDAAAAAEA